MKNPEKDHVKTRLAQSVGDEKVLQAYQRLLDITKEITSAVTCALQVWYSKMIAERDIWESGQYLKFKQQGKDLGQRIKFAFKQAFESGF
ncbi:MAG: hypothetical protein MK198_14100 [Gracilimonas sp.]|uniref:hypothetical protein n=1 Tax=Gracilimonas sp. TaxID=1974203 RepID=UPI003750A468|nr:hypothetical protein [Gracilimonas sp.]